MSKFEGLAAEAADAAAKQGIATEDQAKPYARAGRCRSCRRPMDVVCIPHVARLGDGRILNGVGSSVAETCPRCQFVAGVPSGSLRWNRPIPGGGTALGEVLIGPHARRFFPTAMLAEHLAKFSSGDYGDLGRADDPASDEAKATDPRLLAVTGSAADRNGLAVAAQSGIVRGRYRVVAEKSRGVETIAVACLLGEPSGPTTVVSLTPGEPSP